MRKFIPQYKVSAHLFASDFPSENPRTQTTHYSYTNTLENIKTLIKTKMKLAL